MFKNLIYTLLAVVAVAILPACEGSEKGGNGGKGDENVIILDRQGAAYYLGKVWDFQGEEHADYYVVLSNCEIGQSVQTGLEVPMEVGGWLLFLDLWAEASEDTANAVLPEGEYTFSNNRDMYVAYDQYTIATANIEKVGNQYRILDRQFKGGSVTVEHTSKGYAIEAVMMTTIDGKDTELTFKKLEDVSKLLLGRPELPYIATNPDYVCPTEFGSVPDCGSVCDMIFNATGKRPVVIGKPSPLMPELAMEHTGYSKEETAVIGDRIYTDIKSGLNAGTTTMLVMSGETTYEILEASTEKPHLVLKDCTEILEAL